MPIPRLTLAASAEALTRSLLLFLGMDHALIDFVARATMGAVVILLAFLFDARIACRWSLHRER
jgi:hypothetical protein